MADVIADLDSVGPQAAQVQGDLKGVMVPGQIMISGDGIVAGAVTFGSVVNVDYSFTNVGDKALPAGTATLVSDTNVTLLTSATVTVPALAPGGVFLANWQLRATGSGPVGIGHYQVNTTVAGAQPASVDDIFVIGGGPSPTPTPTPVPGTPVIESIPKVIYVGGSFNITGLNFTAGSVVNFFVATASGAVNAGPLTPSAHLPTQLTVKIPPGTILGNGFVSVQVVNTDKGFAASNLLPALLLGSASAGIPSISSINGVGLAGSSGNPNYATDNVAIVVPQGLSVTLGGSGFDIADGVAIDLFCACPGGKMPTTFLNHGAPGLSATQLSFVVPAGTPTGPGSFVVSNAGPTRTYANKSNAVSVPIGQKISVTSVTQSGSTIAVTGTGFSTLTVINFFNSVGGAALNLGGVGLAGPAIPIRLVNSNKFTFIEPPSAVPGPSYVQALNPPFVPFTSSGNDPGGAFTLK